MLLQSLKKMWLCCLLLFTFLSLSCFSQDLIIKKDSSKIYCKIVKEDSVVLIYRSNKENPPSQAVISKDEVLKYYYATAPAIEQPKVVKTKKPDWGYSEKNKLLHLNLFIGLANPCKEYGKKDLDNKSSGFADNGTIKAASVTLKLSRYIGLTTMYFNQQNPYDHHTIAEFFNTNYPDYRFTLTSSQWKIKGFVSGAYFAFPLKTFKNLFWELNVLFGKPRYTRPELDLKVLYYKNGATEELRDHEGNTFAFTYFYSTGLRYKIMKNIYLVAGIDYMHTKAEFLNIISESTYAQNFYDPVVKNSGTFNRTHKIHSLNLKGGLVYTIEHKRG